MKIRIEFKDHGYYSDGRKRWISKRADKFIARVLTVIFISVNVAGLILFIYIMIYGSPFNHDRHRNPFKEEQREAGEEEETFDAKLNLKRY